MEIFLSFVTLLFLEIILGLDNILILTMIIEQIKNPLQRAIVKYIGLGLALILRLLFLFVLFQMIHSISAPLWIIFHHAITTQDIIMLSGGIFLVFKGLKELFLLFKTKAFPKKLQLNHQKKYMMRIILEIAFIDFIFSIDSVITMVGISNHLWIIVSTNIIAIFLMIFLIDTFSHLIQKDPSLKILGICFIVLVGCVLIASGGFHFEIAKSNLYFAIIFALIVQMISFYYK